MKLQTVIHRKNILFFTVGLALLTMMGILGVDTYLPSIPDIAKEFEKNVSTTQLSIMVYTLCIGFGQLIFGPLSDSIGRRKIMLAGTVIYDVTTYCLTLSTGLSTFLAIRVIQGLSISITLVTAISAVRDVTRGSVAATLYAIIITIEGVVPIVSPLLGGVINDVWGWRAIFLMILGYAIITLMYVYFNFHETLSHERRVTYSLKSSFNTYKEISKQPRFYLPCLSLGLSFSLIYCYVTAAPFILMVEFGYSSTQFGVLSSIIGGFLLLGAALSGKLLKKQSAPQILSLWLTLIASFIVLCIPLLIFSHHVNVFIFFFIVLMFAGGMFESLYTYLTMSSQRTSLGATSALMGAASLVIPSVIGGIGSFLIEQSISIWMVYLLLIILIMTYMLRKYQTFTAA
ncbi:multidrug effflux MFS transporter [Salmonella enterica]|nr:multidrug effflux MFS transporter [Salmonella enterica]EKS5898761.1 multidrug effflux MFS transporter [Salmonella enterica]EKS5943850.1 multidrug effflux MFS transporter [Salmonella enterica]